VVVLDPSLGRGLRSAPGRGSVHAAGGAAQVQERVLWENSYQPFMYSSYNRRSGSW
jgi:hypothetical protein